MNDTAMWTDLRRDGSESALDYIKLVKELDEIQLSDGYQTSQSDETDEFIDTEL